MVEHFVREMTVAEIADQHESLDERQVELSLNRVREAMLRARDFGEFDDVIAR